MRDAHPIIDLPADVPKPAFLTANQQTHHQEAEQNSDRAHETAFHYSELASGPAGFKLLPRGSGYFMRFAYPRNLAKPPARKFTRLCIADEYQRYENEYDEERKNHRLPNRVGEL